MSRKDGLVSSVFFFFFQAEDGIRDIGVTGVQTCALPISSLSRCSDRSCSVPTQPWLTRHADRPSAHIARRLDRKSVV